MWQPAIAIVGLLAVARRWRPALLMCAGLFVALLPVGRPLDDGEVSAYFYGLGWQWIRQHPGAAAALFARKMLYLFNRAHIFLNYSYPFYARDMRTVLLVLIVGAWLLVPLGGRG